MKRKLEPSMAKAGLILTAAYRQRLGCATPVFLPVPFSDTDRGRVVGLAIKVMQVSNEHGGALCPHFPKNILC